MIVIYILVSLFRDTFGSTIVPNISPLDSHMIGWLSYIAFEAGVTDQVGLYVRTMGMVHLNLSFKIYHDHDGFLVLLVLCTHSNNSGILHSASGMVGTRENGENMR